MKLAAIASRSARGRGRRLSWAPKCRCRLSLDRQARPAPALRACAARSTRADRARAPDQILARGDPADVRPGRSARIDRRMLITKAEELDRTIQKLSAMRDGLRHATVCRTPSHMECPPSAGTSMPPREPGEGSRRSTTESADRQVPAAAPGSWVRSQSAKPGASVHETSADDKKMWKRDSGNFAC